MTDNEIVKACKNCLHYEACKGTYSSAKGEEDILYDFDGEMYANSGCEDFIDKDLINRQKAEIENLKDILFDAEGVNLVSYWHQQCKITENGCKNYAKENKNLKAEIERLQKENTILSQNADTAFQDGLNEAQDLYAEQVKAEIKSEAYREFADIVLSLFPADKNHTTISRFTIKQKLKELVGEDDE